MWCTDVQSVRESECSGTNSMNSKQIQSWQIGFNLYSTWKSLSR